MKSSKKTKATEKKADIIFEINGNEYNRSKGRLQIRFQVFELIKQPSKKEKYSHKFFLTCFEKWYLINNLSVNVPSSANARNFAYVANQSAEKNLSDFSTSTDRL